MLDKVVVESSKLVRDVKLSNELAEDGYTIFPLLEESDLKKLTEYYYNFQKDSPEHFYASTHSKDFSFRRAASNFIKEIVDNKLHSKLEDYQLLGGAFVVKPPNGKGLLQPHQDWNLVDEQKTRSYNLWIPLIDVTPENGALFVLSGSHNKQITYRGPGIQSLFNDIEPHVWETMKPLPMKAGEALFYDHSLIHASPINQTTMVRLGVVCGIIGAGQLMQLCYGNKGKITTYRINEDLFLDSDPNNEPEGLEILEERIMNITSLNVKEYDSVFLNINAPKKSSFFARIFGKNN